MQLDYSMKTPASANRHTPFHNKIESNEIIIITVPAGGGTVSGVLSSTELTQLSINESGVSVRSEMRRRFELGNPHKQGCPGILGICPLDRGPHCAVGCEALVKLRLSGPNKLEVTIVELPKKFDASRDMSDKVFVIAKDVEVARPEELGLRTLTIVRGDYPFDWATKTFTANIRGELVSGTRPTMTR